MKRKKNLERAIVLGLLLSTSVYGSAWAAITEKITETPNFSDKTFSENYGDHKITGTSEQGNYDSGIFVGSSGIISDYNIDFTANFNSLYIDIAHDKNPWLDLGDKNYFLSGIMTDGENKVAKLTINSNDFVNIKATSQNNYAVAGVWAQSEDTITINSVNSNVVIEANKVSGSNKSYEYSSSDEANRLHAVYGINASQNPESAAQNGATVNITADNGLISVSASSTSTDLSGEHIYAAANDNGNIILNAGENTSANGDITLTVNANGNNNAYGLDSYYGKQNNITAANNLIVSAESETGEAYATHFIGGQSNDFSGANNSFSAESTNEKVYALLAEDGSKVNITATNTEDNVLDNSFTSTGGTAVQVENSKLTITGDTLMSGTDNGLVVVGNGTSTMADGDVNYDVVVKGDLYAQAQNGYSSQLMTGTKLLVEGDKNINNTMSINANAEETINGNLVTFDTSKKEYVTVNGNAVEVAENANLTIGGNVTIYASKAAFDVTSGSVTVKGNGLNIINGEENGINAVQGSTINLTGTTFIEGKIGVNAVDGSIFNVTGATEITGEDAGLVLSGVEAGTSDEKQSTITGSLGATASFDNGTAIEITSANSKVTGDEYVEGNIGLDLDKANQEVGGSILGMANDTAINALNSRLTVGGNVIVSGNNIGITADKSVITVSGNSEFGGNSITGGNVGYEVKNSSNITLNGDTLIAGTNKDSTGLKVTDSIFTSNGSNVILGGKTGIEATNSTVSLNAGENGANAIAAGETYGEDGINYTGIAINAMGKNEDGSDSSKVNILGAENNIGGAVRAVGAESVVNVGYSLDGSGNIATGANNWIYSGAVIENAGDLAGKEAGGIDVISALYAEDGATINVSGINYIQTYYGDPLDDTTSERVVWAYDKGTINIDGYTNISTFDYKNSPNSMDIAVAAGTATNLTEEQVSKGPANGEWSTVELKYENYNNIKSSISGDILAAYAGDVNISSKDSDSGIDITGNLLSGNGGKLDVNLGNGGIFTGRADDYGDAKGDAHINFFDPAFSSEIHQGGEVNLTMGKGSQWYVQGQSWITSVNATGTDTLIDLVSANTNHNTSAHALTIGTLNGDTRFHMSLDGNRDVSDMLYIKKADGSYSISLEDAVTDSDIGINGLRFATVGAGSNVSFEVGSYDNGAFNVQYDVTSETYTSDDPENNDYNSTGSNGAASIEKPGSDSVDNFFNGTDENAGKAKKAARMMRMAAVNNVMPLADDAANNNSNNITENTNFLLKAGDAYRTLSDAGKTMLNMSRANYSNAIYMDRLNKRVGEAKYLNSEDEEGMWVRIRHDRIGKDDAFRSQNTMYELGYDQKQDCDNGERRIGFAIDYMHGDTGYSDIAGKGEIDRYGLWLYDTWLGDKGHYVDYVAKWGHLSNDFELYTMSKGEKVTGDYSNNVFSISAEYGRKKDMGNDWYIEPQAQLQLARVTGADYVTSQDTKVSVDGINSLIGRAGFRLGKDFGEEKQSTVYIKADVLHEFLGDQDINVMDNTSNGQWTGISYENEGTWYDVGFGFATMMSKNSYAFLDLEKSFGHDNDETYQINAGVQWTF